MYCNAQSIVKKVDELSCAASEHRPDIILLTETWCHQDISDAFLSIDGYELVPDLRMDRADTAHGRGGGLLVYVRTGLTVFKIDNTTDFQQHCVFKISDITVILLYKSPNAPPAAISGLAELVRGAPKNSLIIGDFNLPEVVWDEATGTGRAGPLVEAVQERLLSQLVDFPTQVSGNILDLLITDIPERIVDLKPGDRLGGSDHMTIHVTVNVKLPKVTSNRKILIWNKADFPGMRAQLGSICWEDIFRNQKAEEKWEAFKGLLQAAVNKYVPEKQAGPPGRPPWMTREIAAALRHKRRLWKETTHGRGPDEYKQASKEVKNMIRRSKRLFEKNLAAGGQKNRRQFYAYVKRKTKSRPSVGPLLDSDKNKVTDDKDMAELLNSFFCSVFTSDGGRPAADPVPSGAPEIGDLTVTPTMVEKAIEKLRPDSAAGPDKIGPRLLQELKAQVAPALAAIYNASLREGQVPEDWRTANVTPIFKKGAKADPGNYRPVSLTSVCGKLLERIIKDKIMQHLTEHDLILPSQHSFMPSRSCVTNLLEFFETVTDIVDGGCPFDIVFLDFAKAFDKVPTAPLLAKLQALGVTGVMLDWIRSWLMDRKQRVVLNGKMSAWAAVTSGVPQGSILGPILFIIYINDIDLVLKMIEILRKFADDTKLGGKAQTVEQRAALQRALDELVKWADAWGMQFNIKKCKVMHLGHNNPRQCYRMAGQVLEVTEEERDIGVMVSSTLRPSAQCARAAKTASTVLGQITRAFQYRDRHVFVRLYKQYVMPHLEFAVQAWAPWTACDKEILEKVQKRAVAMVAGLSGKTYEERLQELGMLSLEERRHQADMAQTYKIVTGQDNVQARHWFDFVNSEDRVTRLTADPLNMIAKQSKLELRRNFFSQRVVTYWNNVPPALKRAKNVQIFKKGYRSFRSEQGIQA